MKRFLKGTVLFLLFSFSLCFAGTITDISEKYSSINTFKSQFKQTVFFANLNSTREFSGEFYYKKAKGFLWLYKSPRLRYFLFDGTNLYQYDEEKPFIIKERIDGKTSQNYFFDLIEDVGNLDKHFIVRERGFEKDRDIVQLEPKKEGMIKSVKISFGKELKLEKIEIVEKNGNKNVLSFYSVVLNDKIDDEKFMFKKEKGKEVIER